jgi:hypothetical protein
MAFREEVNILNAKLFYEDKNGWFFNVRGIYRGDIFDTDGNGIINNKSEMAPGYFLLNASLKEDFQKLSYQHRF